MGRFSGICGLRGLKSIYLSILRCTKTVYNFKIHITRFKIT